MDVFKYLYSDFNFDASCGKADFQNVSIQSLYAVLFRFINYVDMQSY